MPRRVFVPSGPGYVMNHRTEVTHAFINGEPRSLETRHTRLWRQFKDRP